MDGSIEPKEPILTNFLHDMCLAKANTYFTDTFTPGAPVTTQRMNCCGFKPCFNQMCSHHLDFSVQPTHGNLVALVILSRASQTFLDRAQTQLQFSSSRPSQASHITSDQLPFPWRPVFVLGASFH